MEKKNLFWSMLAVMMMAVFCGMTTACSSDDDDDNDGSVIGTWTHIDPCEGEASYWVYTLVFNSNNTGTWRKVHEHVDPNEKPCPAETGTFTYVPLSKTEGMVSMNGSYSDEIESFRYVIKSHELYLYDNDGSNDYEIYTKQ